jgi:c-di-GMP-binding flagellar brake protein YcgR
VADADPHGRRISNNSISEWEPEMNERRQYHRYFLHTEIEYEDVSSHDSKESTTKDISRGGICITTEGGPLQAGSLYRLKFLLPCSDEEVKTTARVVWIRQDGRLFDNGLVFTGIDDKYLDIIEEYSIGSVEEK